MIKEKTLVEQIKKIIKGKKPTYLVIDKDDWKIIKKHAKSGLLEKGNKYEYKTNN